METPFTIYFRVRNNSKENKTVRLFSGDKQDGISFEHFSFDPDLSIKTDNEKIEKLLGDKTGGYIIEECSILSVQGSAAQIFNPVNVYYPTDTNFSSITFISALSPFQYQSTVNNIKGHFLLIKGTEISFEIWPGSTVSFYFKVAATIEPGTADEIARFYNNYIEAQKQKAVETESMLQSINKKMDTIIKLLEQQQNQK